VLRCVGTSPSSGSTELREGLGSSIQGIDRVRISQAGADLPVNPVARPRVARLSSDPICPPLPANSRCSGSALSAIARVKRAGFNTGLILRLKGAFPTLGRLGPRFRTGRPERGRPLWQPVAHRRLVTFCALVCVVQAPAGPLARLGPFRVNYTRKPVNKTRTAGIIGSLRAGMTLSGERWASVSAALDLAITPGFRVCSPTRSHDPGCRFLTNLSRARLAGALGALPRGSHGDPTYGWLG
jgi:hypothetical protein